MFDQGMFTQNHFRSEGFQTNQLVECDKIRMDTLQKWLIFASEYTHIDNIISVVYLFYDNYSESETNVVSIETPI